MEFLKKSVLIPLLVFIMNVFVVDSINAGESNDIYHIQFIISVGGTDKHEGEDSTKFPKEIMNREDQIIKNNSQYYEKFKIDGGSYSSITTDCDLGIDLSRRLLITDYFSINPKVRLSYNHTGYYTLTNARDDDTLFTPPDHSSNYHGTLLEYYTVLGGAQFSYYFLRENVSIEKAWYVGFYMLYGYIFYGELSAVPALRDAGFSFSQSEYESRFYGNNLIACFYFGKNLNNYTFGFGYVVNQRWLELQNNNHIYNRRDISYFSAGFELFVGMNF